MVFEGTPTLRIIYLVQKKPSLTSIYLIPIFIDISCCLSFTILLALAYPLRTYGSCLTEFIIFGTCVWRDVSRLFVKCSIGYNGLLST
jgi:hypothetical protein